MTGPQPRVIAALAVCAVLAGLAVWQALAPIAPAVVLEAPRIARTTADKARAPATSLLLPRQSYAEIETRPLFVPGRRPPPVVTASAPPTEARSLDRYAILGIVAAPGRATAILRGPAGETLHLHPGQAIEGWTLETITPARLVFGSAGQHQDMLYKIAKGPPGQGPFRTGPGMQR